MQEPRLAEDSRESSGLHNWCNLRWTCGKNHAKTPLRSQAQRCGSWNQSIWHWIHSFALFVYLFDAIETAECLNHRPHWPATIWLDNSLGGISNPHRPSAEQVPLNVPSVQAWPATPPPFFWGAVGIYVSRQAQMDVLAPEALRNTHSHGQRL